MRTVIADDFTGAVEIGGVTARYGLRAEIQTVFCPESDADIVVIDTDTRSLPPNEAAAKVGLAARDLKDTLFFKKVDSVLRGPVVAELSSALQAVGKKRVLLLPANPALKRTIRNGRYYIGEIEIHRTGFAFDPEYPALSSQVDSLLGRSDGLPVSVLTLDDVMSDSGIIVGEASNQSDQNAWTSQLDQQTLAAGGSGFFESVLGALGYKSSDSARNSLLEFDGCTLFVCGSCSDYSRQALSDMRQSGIPVLEMPAELFEGSVNYDSAIVDWSNTVRQALHVSGIAVMAIDRPPVNEPGAAQRLCRLQIDAVKSVLDNCRVDQLFVEGGSTGSALIRSMGWNRLEVVDELATGVVRVKCRGSVDTPLLTIKPGSYSWPFDVRQFGDKQLHKLS